MINLDKSENWSSWEEWLNCKRSNYGSKKVLMLYGGCIDFDPDKKEDLVGGDKITYDEYLDLQMISIESKNKVRWSFATCYYNVPSNFMGQIERVTKKAVCFKRIYVSGTYFDGECFDGKEEHVWIDKHGLEKYAVGDCLSFFAEPYRYIKTGNGKQIDFGLRNLQNIKKIEGYELPSDEDLMIESINDIICETCYLNNQCYGSCMRNKNDIKALRKDMLNSIKNSKLKKEKK